MPRGRNQMSYFGQCPENEMSHMQRGPGPCFDNYPKMDGHCGMGVSEFKSPMMNADPQPQPAKKKRRTSNNMSVAAQPPPPSAMQDLCPPPLSGYGDTIVASNPFDDTPSIPTMSHMNPMNHVNKHMGVGPCMSPAGPPMMGSISPCHIVGSPMGCGPPVGSPISCGPPMGSCSPMGGSANNANCGPVGSPHTSCNSRQVSSRSPLVCPPMNTSSVMSNSPMNVNSGMPMNRSPSSLGSPLSSVMTSNVRGNSPLDCGGLNINSVGSQKGSPMSVMGSHGINNLNCGSPMGSPSNVPLSNCSSSNMMGSPITSPLSNVPCSMSGGGGGGSGGSDLGINLNGVMNRSPLNAPPSNSVSGSLMCNSSMRGPSPISGGPMNGPMSMNCNPNPAMVNMNTKPDMNMNDLALRENCGPGHLPMKPNNGPGSCGIPVNNVICTRPSDMGGMQCGPMNSPHCNPMMSNQCGPGMSHGPCIGNGINRPPCAPPGISMGVPFDGMNPQFRPTMTRSQFPRGMANVHYGPNSMNGPMSGPPMNGPMNGGPMSGPPMNGPPVNSPMGNHMNGPNMGNMCGGPDLNNLPGCGPNSGNPSSGMHCIGSDQSPSQPSMNSVQCMNPNTMNQCLPPQQPPNSMFNPSYSPFDVNNPRCSPNLHFNPNDMNGNGNFYRSPSVGSNGGGPVPCVPAMHSSVVCTNASDVLGVGDGIMSSGGGGGGGGPASAKNDSNSTVDSDIASVVCGIANDSSDDLNLLGDELLRDTKPDEQQRKTMKDFGGGRLLLGDDVADIVKDEELDGKPCKTDLDSKMAGVGVGNDESKRDDKSDSATSTPNPASSSTATSSPTSSILTTSTCTSTMSTTATSSTATTSGTASAADTAAALVSENGDIGSCSSGGGSSVINVKSAEGATNDDDDDFGFKSGGVGSTGGGGVGGGTGSETHSNASVHSNSNAAADNESSSLDDAIPEDKIKNEPLDDKLLDGEFHDDDDGNGLHHHHKILCNDSKSDANGSSSGSGNGGDVSASGGANVVGDDGSGATTVTPSSAAGNDKEMIGKTVAPPSSTTTTVSSIVKLENDEFFDGGGAGSVVVGGPGAGSLMRKNECGAGPMASGMRPGGNGFTGPPNMMPGSGPPTGFNVPSASGDLVPGSMIPNSVPCNMNDSLCGSPMLPNINRPGMPPNAMSHTMNFSNRNVCNKIYPLNKSKVFNPQNPNAPPIYACGKCHKEINDNDQAILCESGCHFWYHRTCSGLTETAHQLLSSEIYAEWACDSCLNSKNIPLVKYKP